MAYFGNLTNPTIDILKEISTIHSMGFDFAEIGIEGPEGMPDILMKKAGAIKKYLRNKGMFAIGHTTWYTDLGTLHEPVRKAWVAEGRRFIDAAASLGLGKITFHSHSRGMFMLQEKSKKTVLDNFVMSMKELVNYGRKNKITIMLENATEKGEIYNIDDFDYIVSRVSGLKVHVDVGHAFMHKGMKNVINYIATFSDRLEHLHFHDNHGKFDEHLPIGKGKINYKKIVGFLKKLGYDKTITLEVFAKKRNAAKTSMNKIRKLWDGA